MEVQPARRGFTAMVGTGKRSLLGRSATGKESYDTGGCTSGGGLPASLLGGDSDGKAGGVDSSFE